MRSLLLVPALSLAMAAQAPVDYPALKRAEKAAVAAVKADWEAQARAGKPREQILPDLDKALATIRAQGAAAQGEGKWACFLAEFEVTAQFRDVSKELLDRVLKDVPAESSAWQAVDTDLVAFLPMLLGPSGENYVRRMGEKGLPGLRPVVLSGLLEAQIDQGRFEEAKGLTLSLEKAFPGDPAIAKASAHLKGELLTTVGTQAPDFALASLDDPKTTFTKASFQGRYLLVDFWGTWCGYCVRELPTTHKVYAAYHDKGLEILSLAADKAPGAVAAFRLRPGTPMPWHHAFIGRGKDEDPVVKAYGINGFPSLFLLGPDGTILAKGEDLREAKLATTLARFLKK